LKIRCDYCGNYIDDAEDKCFFCGAPNSKKRRTGNQVPKTIEELKQWYIDMKLPDENTTRFFIGRDYPGPRAFGIFKQSDGDFVVYKNKTDGTRTTRYVGKDEEYAVQEIYLKLKEEMQNQKMHNEANNTRFSSSSYTYIPTPVTARTNNYNRYSYSQPSQKGMPLWLIITLIIVFCVMMSMCSTPGISSGSGRYNSYNSSSWNSSYYDDYDSDYNSSSSWSDSWSSSSWDSDWDSSSSWDSGWSDWDSDW